MYNVILMQPADVWVCWIDHGLELVNFLQVEADIACDIWKQSLVEFPAADKLFSTR